MADLQGILYDGAKTVTTAGTRVPLAATRTLANWLLIQFNPSNSGSTIYLGGPSVSSTSGVEVSAGDSDVIWPMVAFNTYDLNLIYIDAATSGDGVKFIYTRI